MIGAHTLISALMFLMTRYAHNQDQSLIQPIMDHFNWLENHPGLSDTQIQKTSSRLKNSWSLIATGCANCHSVSSKLH